MIPLLLLLFLTISKMMGIVPGIIYYKKLSISFRLILAFVILSLATEYAGYIIVFFTKSNIWLNNCYYIISFYMLVYAGQNLMGKKYKNIFAYVTLVVGGVFFINALYKSINQLFTWAFLVIDIVLIIQYLYILLTVVITSEKILQSATFWSCLPIILFFGCNIPIIGYFNYLANTNTELLSKLFDIIVILNYVCFPLFGISFYLQGKKASINRPANVY